MWQSMNAADLFVALLNFTVCARVQFDSLTQLG